MSTRGLRAAAAQEAIIATAVIDLLERARKQHEAADRARRLIAVSTDRQVIARLTTYADELDAVASALEQQAVTLGETVNRTAKLSEAIRGLVRDAAERLAAAKAKLPPKR